MNNTNKLIEEFQCPGCVCGHKPDSCERFKLEICKYVRCTNHISGTRAFPGGINFCLGLPKGFNRCGFDTHNEEWANNMLIRIWEGGSHPVWDKFNVPVWAMEEKGFLFVRTYMPRMNRGMTDVIEDGKIKELCPNIIDVSEFIDEID